MKYDVYESEEHKNDWIAGAVLEGEGDIYIAIFSGPEAKERASEYASWKNAQTLSLDCHSIHTSLSS